MFVECRFAEYATLKKKKKDSKWGKTTVIFFKATWDTCKSAKEATQPALQLLMQ